MHSTLKWVCHEMENCVSMGVSHLRQPDIDRLKSYVQEFVDYKAHVMSQNPQDWPHAADMAFPLEPLGDAKQTENVTLREILAFFRVMEADFTKCQSKDLPQGLRPADSERFDEKVAYLNSLIAFAESSTPTDRPESSASEVG